MKSFCESVIATAIVVVVRSGAFSMFSSVARLIGIVLLSGVVLLSATPAPCAEAGAPGGAATNQRAASRCEISLAPDGCPSDSTKPPVFDDDWEHAGMDDVRCLRRAMEYLDWCASSGPVTARYYEGAKVKREEKAERKTRCEIRFTQECCSAFPADMRMRWNDDAENASSDEVSCMRRAHEYYDYCGSSSPVIARYYEGAKVKREEKAERKTRCELRFTEERCPSLPAEFRMRWNDDWEHACTDEVRCVRRAMEYFDYCASSAAVVARYYEGATVKREVRAERKTRCEIRLTEERCSTLPAETRMRWNDDAENASSDATRCRRRAAEWKSYCKAQRPVTARFYSDGSVLEETVAR